MVESPRPSPLDAFAGHIEPTRVPLVYQVGLGIVAMAMVLLPLIYIALIVAMGWVVRWHLMNDAEIFNHVRGRGVVLALVVYLGPAIAGAIFVLFLVKPLFSRAPKPPPPFKLSESDEPMLFAFVRKICEIVGAPVPREIHLDAQVNASAGFRRGWLSFFGNDLVLVLGMPLAAGMTMRQVAGVLAHEFGHFAQGAGMRFNFIIRSVNAWFARVVFERDRWDQKLDEWAQSDEWWLKVIFLLAKGGVWLGRKILWCLMYVGHAISCFMSRQMEFDADSYEAKLAGSAEFARTAGRLRALNAAHGAAMNDAYQTYQAKELPDDLPALVVWRDEIMPADVRDSLAKQTEESKTAWNDTHPADPDRIKAALALQAAGVFQHDAPASELFADFSATSKAVTRHYFEHILDVPADKVQFRSAARIVQDRQSADASDKHLDAFFGKGFHFLRTQPIEPGAADTWREAAAQMNAAAAGYAPHLEQLNKLYETWLKQVLGCDLLGARFTLPTPGDFALASDTQSDAEGAIVQTHGRLQRLFPLMSEFESAATRRLGAALGWWIANRTDASSCIHLDRLLDAQRPLATVVPGMMQASRDSRSLHLLFENASNHNDGITLERQLRTIAKRIEVAASHCIATLGDAAHPYLENHPPIAQVLHLPEKSANEWARANDLAKVCTEALIPLLVRIMGDLCGIALAAEKELQADPSPDQPRVADGQ